MSQHVNRIAATAACLVLGSALSACSVLPREDAELTPPLVKPAQENYRTVTASKGTIVKDFNGNGSFVSVASDVAQYTGDGGRIGRIAVSAGDEVHKGDVLAQLLLDGMDLKLKEQELALERAKYDYKHTSSADADARKIAALQLELEQLKYDRLKAQLDSRVLTAKIDGQVTFAADLKEGDRVEPYQSLVTVSDPSRLRVSMDVDAAGDLGNVEVGTPAEIEADGQTYAAKVVQTPSSAPATTNKELAEQYSRTMILDIAKLPADVEIGDLASVRIITERRENTIIIPKSSLRSYLGRTFVRVLEDGSRLREVDVETGITTPTEVEIVKGLEGNEVIVLP